MQVLTNPDFLSAHQADEQEPVFVVSVHYGADVLRLTTAPVTGLTGTIFEHLDDISGFSQRIDDSNLISTVGHIDVTAIDHDADISTYIANKLDLGEGIRHKKVEIHQGYRGLEWAGFKLRRTYRVVDFKTKDDKITLQTADIQRDLNREIMQPHLGWLAKTVSATATLIPVNVASAEHFPTLMRGAEYGDWSGQAWSVIRLGDELIMHSGFTNDPLLGLCFNVIKRGAFQTAPVEHKAEDSEAKSNPEIIEHIYLEGPAPKVLWQLAAGYDPDTPTTVLPSHWCLQLPQEWLRWSDWDSLDNDLWNRTASTGRWATVAGFENISAKELMQQELLTLCNCAMPVYANGELGLVRRPTVTRGAAGVATLTTNDAIDWGDLHYDQEQVHSRYRIEWDYHPVTEIYRTTTEVEDEDAGVHGEADTKSLQLRCVRHGKTTDVDLLELIDGWRDRHAGPPLLIDVTVQSDLDVLEVADVVRVQLPITDPTTGQDLNRAFEIISIQNDWVDGTVKLALRGSSQKSKPQLMTVGGIQTLNDDWYSSEGQALSSVLSITNGVITANGALTGSASVTDAAAIYYYIGDLELPADKKLTITDNVQLRIMGRFTRNGDIDGEGGSTGDGYLGSTTTTDSYDEAQYIKETNLGITSPYWVDVPYHKAVKVPADSSAGASEVPRLALTNDNGALDIPYTDLRGKTGAGVRTITQTGFQELDRKGKVRSGSIAHTKGDERIAGGAGGAALLIVHRGMNGSGKINTSGSAGSVGDNVVAEYTSLAVTNKTLAYGSSAGGAPGALVEIRDGVGSFEVLTGSHLANYGSVPSRTVTLDNAAFKEQSYTMSRATPPAMGDAASVQMYVPAVPVARPDTQAPPERTLSITTNVIPNSPRTKELTWSTIEIDVSGLQSTDSARYRIRQSGGEWQNIGLHKATALHRVPAVDSEYEIEVAAVSQAGVEGSKALASATVEQLADLPSKPTEQLQLQPVHGLMLENRLDSNANEYKGLAPHIKWQPGTNLAKDLGQGVEEAHLDHYLVRVFDASNANIMLGEFQVKDPKWTPPTDWWAKKATRSIVVNVRAVATDAKLNSAPKQLTATNPATKAPTAIKAEAGRSTLNVSWQAPGDLDFSHVAWRVLTAGKVIAEGTEKGSSITVVRLTPETDYTVELTSHDVLGQGESTSVVATTLPPLNATDVGGLPDFANLDFDNFADVIGAGQLLVSTNGTDGVIIDGETSTIQTVNQGFKTRLGLHTIDGVQYVESFSDGNTVVSGRKPNGDQIQTGTFVITGGSGFGALSDRPQTLADINQLEATKFAGIEAGATNTKNTSDLTDDANLGDTANWPNVLNVPARFTDSAEVGLNLTANYLGYYANGQWQSYMDDSGFFRSRSAKIGGDANDYMMFDGSALVVRTDPLELTATGDLRIGDEATQSHIAFKGGQVQLGRNVDVVGIDTPNVASTAVTLDGKGMVDRFSLIGITDSDINQYSGFWCTVLLKKGSKLFDASAWLDRGWYFYQPQTPSFKRSIDWQHAHTVQMASVNNHAYTIRFGNQSNVATEQELIQLRYQCTANSHIDLFLDVNVRGTLTSQLVKRYSGTAAYAIKSYAQVYWDPATKTVTAKIEGEDGNGNAVSRQATLTNKNLLADFYRIFQATASGDYWTTTNIFMLKFSCFEEV